MSQEGSELSFHTTFLAAGQLGFPKTSRGTKEGARRRTASHVSSAHSRLRHLTTILDLSRNPVIPTLLRMIDF